MDPTISVSKGCFVFKASGKKRIRKGTVSVNEHWHKQYESLKASTARKQKEFYSKEYEEFVEEIVEFVQTSGEMLSEPSAYLVPAGILLPGMALADHEHIFSHLISKIKEDVTNHVALLKGKDCPSIRVAVESIVRQFTAVLHTSKRKKKPKKSDFIDEESDSSEQEDEDSDDDSGVFMSEFKRNRLNFLSLSRWYSSIEKDKSEERKRWTSKTWKSPLVVIVSDVEGSSPSVLQDLIYISKNYLKKLPIVLIFSIATAPSLLGRYISEHTLSYLSLKYISSSSSFAILPKMIKEFAFSTDMLFCLGGRTLKILVDTFIFLDNSLAGFMRMYQFCLMEHFYGNPVSALCCSLKDLKPVVKSLTSADLEAVRQLPSFRRYVESKPAKERAPLLLDDTHLKKVVIQLMTNLHARMWEFHTAVKVLNAVSSQLPGSPFGHEIHDTYVKATTKDISSSPEFEEAFKLLKLSSQEEFLGKFQDICLILQDSVKNCPGSGSNIKEYVEEMRKSLDKMAGEEQENDEDLASSSQTPRKSKVSGRLIKDSPVKATHSPSKNADRKETPPCSPAKNKLSRPKEVKEEECSLPARSPRKSISDIAASDLHNSPSKRLRGQTVNGVYKESTPQNSPRKRSGCTPLSETPGRHSQGNLLKTPEGSTPKKTGNTPKKSNSTTKDLMKETLADLGLGSGKMDRSQLKERLLQLSRQKKELLAKEESKWDELKEKILDSLKKALITSLGEGSRPLASFPLYEVAVFENVNALRSHLIPPSPQAALHSALTNPKQYLECDCCELQGDMNILPSLPDVSIIYKLHLECGRMINLYDWLQAFSMIVNSNSDEEKEAQVDVNMQARFMQAVAELQFMGFVKTTKRKTDHVVRLTWGGISS